MSYHTAFNELFGIKPIKVKHIEYKIIDLDKIKTIDDVVLIMKSLTAFKNIKCVKGDEWQTLGHLLSDETFTKTIGVVDERTN
jgi:hypothetical protein